MTSLRTFRRRVWLELRFIGHAFMQRDWDDPRVQAIVEEKLRRRWRAVLAAFATGGVSVFRGRR